MKFIKRVCFIVTFIVSFFFLPGCKATYPYKNVEESIKKICRKEYNLTVYTRIAGFTVFAYVTVDNLMPEIALFNQDFVEILSNIMNSLSRVVLSSDYPFQFIVLHAIDSRGQGAYMTLIRHTDDIRRLLTGDISHNEYFDRIIMRTGINEDMTPEFFLISLFNTSNPLASFLSITNRSYTVEDVRSVKTEEKKYLVFCRTKEIFKPSKEAEILSIGHGEYLLELHMNGEEVIKKVTPLFHITGEGARKIQSVPDITQRYGAFSTWRTHLPTEEINLPEFLAEQISLRIKRTITNDPLWSKKYLTNSVSGSFTSFDDPQPESSVQKSAPRKDTIWLLDNTVYRFFNFIFNRFISFARKYIPSLDPPRPSHVYGSFQFNLDVQERILFMIEKQIQPQIGVKQVDLLEDIYNKIIQRVLNRYGFHHFKEIRLVNTNTGQTLTVPQ